MFLFPTSVFLSLTEGSDPKAFEFRFLFMAIMEGRCHLAVPPSATKSSCSSSRVIPHTVEGLVQLALDEFRLHFDGIPQELWESKAKALIVQDLDTWRMDPKYVMIRHCCVLVHPRDPVLSDDIETKVRLTGAPSRACPF